MTNCPFSDSKDEGSRNKSALSPPQVHPSVKYFSSNKKLTSFTSLLKRILEVTVVLYFDGIVK
jgi:hypothetical protein